MSGSHQRGGGGHCCRPSLPTVHPSPGCHRLVMDPVLENLQERGWRKTQGSSHRVLFCHNQSFFCPQSPESQVAGACHGNEEL